MERKHKEKPVQFVSVAGGVQKRLEASIRKRKILRLSILDRVRNKPECDRPLPAPAPSKAQLKIEHRRQQLEKWKAEKEKKKKEEQAHKKKSFVVGIARAPLTYVPPPVIPKPRKLACSVQPNTTNRSTYSFAPQNAPFRTPETINLPELESLAKTYTIKSIAPKNSIKWIKTPEPAKYVTENKSFIKVLYFESTSSEEENSSDEKSMKRKSVRTSIEASSTNENLNSESTSSVEDFGKPSRMSLAKDTQKNTTISSTDYLTVAAAMWNLFLNNRLKRLKESP